MKDKNICPICGETTFKFYGNYRKDGLCAKHAKDFKDGKIKQCTDCGKWHESEKDCGCKQKEIIKPIISDDLTCIICGKPSNGKHFCINCYKKYKERSVDIRITNCKDTEILDEYGNLDYKCPDGRKVRSRAEAMISSWFWDKRIRVVYEECLYYQENGETKTLKPDFYLPDYNIYIEYNELTNKKYLNSKEYVMKKYEENGVKVFIMNDADLKDISRCLCPVLGILK